VSISLKRKKKAKKSGRRREVIVRLIYTAGGV
jgi:hypothetical protein